MGRQEGWPGRAELLVVGAVLLLIVVAYLVYRAGL